MAQSLPLAHRRLRLAQIFRRDPMQCDQNVVIRAQLDVIAGRSRTVQDHTRQIVPVRRTQILNQSTQRFLYSRVNHLPSSSRASTTEITSSITPSANAATAAKASATTE